MNKRKGNIRMLLVCMSALAVTVYSLSSVVLSPGSVLLSNVGDGAKNYFTFLYHSLYGEGIWFGGMNYPYGEHIVFTDGQPAFSVLSGYLNQYLLINPLVIMHLLIGIGFFLGIIYVYKILLRFKVPYIWAIAFACLIIIMSPQQLKLTAHFSLVYACVLPMLFYYNLTWLQTESTKYICRLFAVAMFIAFIHVYFSLMYCFWIAIYSLAYTALYKRQLIHKLKHLFPLWLAVITPVVMLKVFMLITDPVSDRPGYPYGARDNRTYSNDIYSSYISPIWQWLQKNVAVGELSKGAEGYTYIGFSAMFILSIGCILYLFSIIKHRQVKPIAADNHQSLTVWMWIAAGMLIFASSIVFRRCFVCLDYASFIRQFRAVGRFAWAFYYITTIASVVLLYRWYASFLARNKRVIAYLLAGLFFTLWLYEAAPFAAKTRALAKSGLENYNSQYNIKDTSWETFLQKNGYTKDSFQAMIVLPYVHIGTEKLGVNAGYSNILIGGFHASLKLHLPLMDVMMSRSSWSQAFNQVKVYGGPLTKKHFVQMSIKYAKPLLILHPDNIELDRDELHLVNAARSLGKQKGYNVYALYPEELRIIEKRYDDSLISIFDAMHAKDTCLNYCGKWAAEHYDNGSSAQILFGAGAEKAIEGNTATIFNESITPEYNNQEYEFSAWTLVSDEDYKIGRFSILGYNSRDSLVVNEMVLVQESVDNSGLWLRASKYFKLPEGCVRIKVELINIINPAYLALDELMIRPADATIMSKRADGSGMVNNHLFR